MTEFDTIFASDLSLVQGVCFYIHYSQYRLYIIQSILVNTLILTNEKQLILYDLECYWLNRKETFSYRTEIDSAEEAIYVCHS